MQLLILLNCGRVRINLNGTVFYNKKTLAQTITARKLNFNIDS